MYELIVYRTGNWEYENQYQTLKGARIAARYWSENGSYRTRIILIGAII